MKKIIILHDVMGSHDPLEDEDTRLQATATREALEGMGFAVTLLPFTFDLRGLSETLQIAAPLLVFSFIDTVEGRDDLIHLAPMLLDHLGIPYTGCPMRAVFCTMHKPLAKRLLQGAGLATAPWLDENGIARCERLGAPMIFKSADKSASHGLAADSVTEDAGALRALLADRKQKYGGEWFAEKYIDGREFTVPMLAGEKGPEALEVAELVFGRAFDGRARIADHAAKWQEESSEFKTLSDHFGLEAENPALAQTLEGIGHACWMLFSMAGYGRIDLRVDKAGKPWILEANTNPFICPRDNTYVASAARKGLSFVDVVRRLAHDALTRAGRRIPEELR